MTTGDLTVHDISSSDTTVFNPNGTSGIKRRVTYFIGSHGPFTLEYEKSQGTSDRIKADIRAHVADIQNLDDLAP